MAAIAVGLLALCCCSSSASAGGFFGGLIPGTKPHFLKTIKASEFKELIDELKAMKKNREMLHEKFPNPGPDMSGLNDEERVEYIKIVKDNLVELRESDSCKKMKELMGSREDSEFNSTLNDYPDDIFTLSGTKRKHEVWENAIGLDKGGTDELGKFTARDFEGAVQMCMSTEEEFEKFIER